MAYVVQAPNDKQQLTAMLEQVEHNVGLPDVTSADAGYFSEQAIEACESKGAELLVPPDRQIHGKRVVRAPRPECASTVDWMRFKLRSAIAAALYRMRKAIVEPVFGQIKSVRGLRRFLLRGLGNVRDEFRLMALTHNVLKLHRHQLVAAPTGQRESSLSTCGSYDGHRSMHRGQRVVGFQRTTTYGWGARGERLRSPRPRQAPGSSRGCAELDGASCARQTVE